MPGAAGVPLHGISRMEGDLKYSKTFTHYDFVNPNAPKQGKVTIAKVGTFESLNPWVLKGIAEEKITLTRATLLSRSPEESFSLYGAVAESVELPKDRSWIIFNLRPQACWETGAPITADDVIFSWKTWLDVGQPFMKTFYKKVQSMEKLGKFRVKMIFKKFKPQDRELPLILSMMPLLPEKEYKGKDLTKITHLPLISNGPYKVKSVDFGRSIVFERNKNFWGKDLPLYKGRYNFDEIRLDYYRSEAAKFEAFKSGEIDYIEEENPQKWKAKYHFAPSKNILKEELEHNRPIGMTAFALNTRRDMFKDIRVRQAFNLVFNFDWVNKTCFQGMYTRIKSFFENGEFAPRSKPSAEEVKILRSFKEKLSPLVFKEVYTSSPNNTPASIRENVQKAQDLLREAGWILKKGKLVHSKTQQPFVVEILISDSFLERIALGLMRDLKLLGVTATVKLVEGAQYERRKVDFDYDILFHSWYGAKSPGNEMLNYISSKSADAPGSRNYPGIKNPVVDAIAEATILCTTKKDLANHVKALDRVLMSGFYVIPLGYLKKDMIAYVKRLKHPKHSPHVESRLESWWTV